MIEINVKEFPEYDLFPKKGKYDYSDSRVFNIEFLEYSAKIHIGILYNRWFYPQTQDSPEEDEIDIKDFNIELIRIWKEGKEILKEKEFRRLEKYIKNNIKFI